MAPALRLAQAFASTFLIAALAVVAGCGGGDDGDDTCIDSPNRDPRLPSCAVATPPPGTTQSSIAVALRDASGNSVNAVEPTAPAYAEARVLDTNGRAAPNIVVKFKTSDATGGFTPPSGTALTDGGGVARVTLLAGSTLGAFTVTASTDGNATGTVTETGKTGVVLAGSATAGYAVSTTYLPATGVGSIKFVGADPTNIALKGTGGVGRQEFSTVTFQVFGQAGQPMQRAQVNFTLNTTAGGLSLLPQTALTDANGRVSTVVSAGTMPTPVVMVTASVPNAGVTTVSNVLVVSTGLPVDSRVSLSTTIGNFEGWDFDVFAGGPVVTVGMNDHFGNPAADGTAASFTASHGSIEAACVSGNVAGATTPPSQTTNSQTSGFPGACSVRYFSDGTRPRMGRAVVTAFLRGEEDFYDANGNNVCDGCLGTTGAEFKPVHDVSPDVFRDDNENVRWDPNEPCIGPNANGRCSTAPDGVYNGVLANPKIPDAQQTTYLSRTYVAIWSGSYPYITVTPGSACAGFSPPGIGTSSLHVRIVDVNGNPMPAGTKIVFTGDAIVRGAPASFTVPNYLPGLSQTFVGQPLLNGRADQIRIDEYDVPVTCSSSGGGFVVLTVTTPRGIATTRTIPIP